MRPSESNEETELPRHEQVAHARFWSQYYRNQWTPWDMGHETPVFRALREAGRLPVPTRRVDGTRSRVFVPGCGSGYDALALAVEGYEVSALDFAPEPLEQLDRLAAQAGVSERLHTVLADIFELPPGFQEAFDMVLEYT